MCLVLGFTRVRPQTKGMSSVLLACALHLKYPIIACHESSYTFLPTSSCSCSRSQSWIAEAEPHSLLHFQVGIMPEKKFATPKEKEACSVLFSIYRHAFPCPSISGPQWGRDGWIPPAPATPRFLKPILLQIQSIRILCKPITQALCLQIGCIVFANGHAPPPPPPAFLKP